jgi:serralysin
VVYGGSGNDVLYGDLGADTIRTDGGTDTLFGGNGSGDDAAADTFVINSSTATTGVVINDFTAGTDKINLAAFANASGAVSFVTGSSFATGGTVAQARFDAANNNLLIDTDGNATTDVTIKLTGVSSVASTDFVLS